MRLLVSEVIWEAELAQKEGKSDEEIALILKKNDSPVLRQVLKYSIDPTILFNLPPGDPGYRPSIEGTGVTLYAEKRRFYHWIKKHPTEPFHPILIQDTELAKKKREDSYMYALETLEPHEAALLVKMVNKDVPVKASIVQLAFPDLELNLMWDEEEEKVEEESPPIEAKEVQKAVVPAKPKVVKPKDKPKVKPKAEKKPKEAKKLPDFKELE